MERSWRQFVRAEEGQDLVEYALLAALITTVSITLLITLGQTIPKVFQNTILPALRNV